jgi:hypothetical protein
MVPESGTMLRGEDGRVMLTTPSLDMCQLNLVEIPKVARKLQSLFCCGQQEKGQRPVMQKSSSRAAAEHTKS